jgi:hypothetical protein
MASDLALRMGKRIGVYGDLSRSEALMFQMP